MWEEVIWPLVLDTNKPYFTLEQYHNKRDQVCNFYGIPHSKISGGFISLTLRGLIQRGGGEQQTAEKFLLHHHLISFLARKVTLEYGIASRKICSKK